MSAIAEPVEQRTAAYVGLRMSAAEYLELPEDTARYELVDGVVLMSPSPSFMHQDVATEILTQLRNFLRDHPLGKVVYEVDVEFDTKLVYRPDLVYVRADRRKIIGRHVRGAPDLIVEVLSPETRRYDAETKRTDYERYGVSEYWLVDERRETLTCLRLADGAYAETQISAATLASTAVPGFVLDLAAVWKIARS